MPLGLPLEGRACSTTKSIRCSSRPRASAIRRSSRRCAPGHPYELPEIIAVPIERGLPAYLDWVAAETRALKRIVLLLLLLALAAPAAAQLKLGGGTDNLLEPEKAFRFSARALDASSVEVSFAIADGYYLYRERFKFAAEGNPAVRLGAPELPRGIAHKDEFFGEMQIYRKDVRIRLPVEGDGPRST